MINDIADLLAEPGQRQLVLAGTAYGIGFVREVVSTVWGPKINAVLARMSGNPSYERAPMILPLAIAGSVAGLDMALEHQNPVLNSYTDEAAVNAVAVVLGYTAGRVSCSFIMPNAWRKDVHESRVDKSSE